MSEHSSNPYVGPRTFEEDDAQFFFGREREARDLLSLVISEPLVLFYAQSGAGKSSIINTRVVPGLRQEHFIVLPVTRVGGELPEGITDVKNVFVFNLLLSLSREQQADANEWTQTTLTEYLQGRREADLGSYTRPVVEDAEEDEDWEDDVELARVVIIDQFEEILTTHLARWHEREEFFMQLRQAMRDDPLLWVVLTLREDYVAALDPFARLLPGRLRARFHMERMEAAAARQAITEPAAQNGRPFAKGVARSLVDNLRQLRTQDRSDVMLGQYIEPVQLQVVCYQLWENLKNRPSGPITQEDVDELGNVDAALSQFYEHAIANVLKQTHESELTVRNWFDRQLITEAETRGTVYQGKEETAGLDNRIVNLLANQFLLRAEIRAGGTWYELVHDRFVTPILQANQAWRLQQSPLIRAAEEWDRAGRPRSKLYQGEPLKEVLAEVNRESLEPLVQQFLTASEDAQSQRDLAQSRVEAEAQRQRAETEAKTARRLRILSRALIVVFMLAVAAAVFASYEANQSFEQEELANANAERAAINEAEARENAVLAATRAAEAQNSAALAATSAAEAARNEAEARNNANLAATREAEAVAAEATAAAIAEVNAELAAAAETAREAAVANAEESRQLGRLSLAQSLSAVSPRIVERSNNTELAALLAVEAYRVNTAVGSELLETIDNSLREILALDHFNRTLTGHNAFVYEAAFNADETMLATGGADGRILLHDLTQHAIPYTILAEHQTTISSLLFSPSGQWLASSDLSGDILVWNLQADWDNLTPIRLTQGHTVSVHLLAFRNEQTLLSGSTDRVLNLWNLTDATPENPPLPQRHTGFGPTQRFIAISPDGNMLATANDSNIINLWDLAIPGIPVLDFYFTGNEAFINDIVFSSDIQRVAAANEAGVIRIWDLTQPNNLPIRIETLNSIQGLSLGPNTQTMASISGELSDLSIRLWDLSVFNGGNRNLPPEGISTRLFGHTSNILNVNISPQGNWLASVSFDGTARLWNLAPPTADAVVLSGHDRAAAVTVSADGQTIVTGDAAGVISVWETADLHNSDNQPAQTIAGDGVAVRDLVITPDNQTLVAADAAGRIQLWDLTTVPIAATAVLTTHTSAVNALAISPDGRLLASGGDDNHILLWNLPDILAALPVTYTTLFGHTTDVSTIAFSSDGQRMASGGFEQPVFVWDLSGLEAVGTAYTLVPTQLSGHEVNVSSVAFSPNGRYLVSGSYDLTVRLWDLEDLNTPPIILRGHDDWVYAVAFSPDGNTVASAGWDRHVNLWDVRVISPELGSKTPTLLTGHEAQVVDLAYFANSGILASASQDGTVRLWNTNIEHFVETACAQVHRNLSWEEWQRYLGSEEAYRLTCPDLPVHRSFIESARMLAREQQIDSAVARFEEAIALGASLDFDPRTEVLAEAGQGLLNQAQRLAEQGRIVEAIAAIEQAQVVDPTLVISAENWLRLCDYGKVWEETAVTLPTCQNAVNLAVNSDDATLNQELCALIDVAAYSDTIRPTCARAVDLVIAQENLIVAHQLCFLQSINSEIAQLVAPVCDYANEATPRLNAGVPAVGTLAAGSSDWWAFTANEGQTITLNVMADNADILDTYLILLTADGTILAENDDFDGTNSRIEAITIPADGSYLVSVRGFSDADFGSYVLTMTQ